MKTSPFVHHNRRLAVRLRVISRIEAESLLLFVRALALAMPLSLLATDGATYVVGVVYAVFYAFLMLLPTALQIILLFDAFRVLFGSSAVFVPFFNALGRVADKRPSKELVITPFLKLGVICNPLGAFTREIWILAFRFHPKAMGEIRTQENKIAAQMGNSGMTGRIVAVEIRSMPHHVGE